MAKTCWTWVYTVLRPTRERLGDPAVREPLRHEGQHLALPVAEHVEGVRPDERLDEQGVHERAPGGHPLERALEHVAAQHVVLEQVPDARRRPVEEHGGVRGDEVLREHEHADVRVPGADEVGEPQALVGVGGRHPDVEQHDVGGMRTDQCRNRVGADARSQHLVPAVAEQGREAGAHEQVVLDDDQAHGISIVRAVPDPGSS